MAHRATVGDIAQVSQPKIVWVKLAVLRVKSGALPADNPHWWSAWKRDAC
jgi:hypothetical protein